MLNIVDPRHDLLAADAVALSVHPRSSGLALWAPDIVLAKMIDPRPARSAVLPGEPGLRPAAVQAQIGATCSVLDTLTDRGERLGQRAAAAEARALGAACERERVTAVMESYRVKTQLDELLRHTTRKLSALVQERGLK